MRDINKIYEIYLNQAKRLGRTTIGVDEFEHIWDQAHMILTYFMQEKQKREPYIAIDLDGYFHLYMEVNKDKLVTNIWDNDQLEYLLKGKKK